MEGEWGGGAHAHLVDPRELREVVVLTEVQHQSEKAQHLGVEAELQKEPVVILPNTVIDPAESKRESHRPQLLHTYTYTHT